MPHAVANRPVGSVVAALFAAGMLAFVVPTFANKEGVVPPQGCTCHSDDPAADVTVTVDGWPAVYTPLSGYPLVVSAVGDVPGSDGGFSVEVNKGSLSSSDPLVAASGRVATHTGPGQRAWPLLWLAPAEDSGGVALTVFVNLVNGDGSEGPEDHWALATFTAVEKAAEPPKPSNLRLSFIAEGGLPIAGTNFSIVAHLTNFTDAPIPNALVAFSAHLSFGVLPLGSNRTDASGTTRLNYSVVAAGEFLFLAHYDGSSKNLSADANATVAASDPNNVFEGYYRRPSVSKSGLFDPVRIPLGLVVGGVWLTFLYAGLQVLRLRKQGAPSNDGIRDLMRLAFARTHPKEPKKP